MAQPYRWQCATCGQWHDDLPLCFGADAPAIWYVISEAEKKASTLDKSICEIVTAKESAFYVRGHLEIPIRDHNEPFIWGVWASLSELNFERTLKLWNESGRENEPAYFGWLSTAIPVYPDTMFLKSSVQTQPVGSVPLITVEHNDHPLSVDQHHGVKLEKVHKWLEQLLHA